MAKRSRRRTFCGSTIEQPLKNHLRLYVHEDDGPVDNGEGRNRGTTKTRRKENANKMQCRKNCGEGEREGEREIERESRTS